MTRSRACASFQESVPAVAAKLQVGGERQFTATERKFEDVVQSAEQAAVLVLVYCAA